MFRKFIGTLVILVGIGLFIGNVTGVFPTFSYAGFITMGVGGLIFGGSD
jgi:hypothetical protein